jgi:LysM repeat protein
MNRLAPYRFLQFGLLTALVAGMTACQFLEEVVPTAPPAAPENPVATPDPADESPRLRNLQDVPPTWTPSADQSGVSETPVSPLELTPRAAGQATYVVQPGDTLAGIALQYNLAVEDLARANDIDDLDHIEVGQVLVIPGF